MRVISKDRAVNVPYEGNMFCIIKDEENKNFVVAVRNSNLTGFMPLAEYKTEEAAQIAFDQMIAAGEVSQAPNSAFTLI